MARTVVSHEGGQGRAAHPPGSIFSSGGRRPGDAGQPTLPQAPPGATAAERGHRGGARRARTNSTTNGPRGFPVGRASKSDRPHYASRGRRYGQNSVEATRAFLFFRNLLIESMLSVYEAAAVHSPHAWSSMFRKVNEFTDLILITLLETYEAYQRAGR